MLLPTESRRRFGLSSLTPTLSRWERVNVSQLRFQAMAVGTMAADFAALEPTLLAMLPLPAGEGWGEGEANIDPQPRDSTETCSDLV